MVTVVSDSNLKMHFFDRLLIKRMTNLVRDLFLAPKINEIKSAMS